MRRYEVVFVLAPTLTEEEFDLQVESYSKVAQETGADVVEIDKWGKRRLAFPVQKHHDGYYTVMTLDEPGGKAVAELERRFKVADSVIRFLTVRIDLEQKRAEKFERKRDERQQRKAAARKEAAGAERKEAASAAAARREAAQVERREAAEAAAASEESAEPEPDVADIVVDTDSEKE
jgi:small subunit ribosomal protein S6